MDVHFSMQLMEGVMGAALAEGLHKKFKLGSKLAISAPPTGPATPAGSPVCKESEHNCTHVSMPNEQWRVYMGR